MVELTGQVSPLFQAPRGYRKIPVYSHLHDAGQKSGLGSVGIETFAHETTFLSNLAQQCIYRYCNGNVRPVRIQTKLELPICFEEALARSEVDEMGCTVVVR